MDSRSALTLSIGVLGGLAVALTAEVITVPIWVVFLTWASFFFVGGGVTGIVHSLSSNLVGVLRSVSICPRTPRSRCGTAADTRGGS